MGPAKKLAAKYFPGVPVVPTMANGYTDATFLGAVGIPTYGVPGSWGDPDGNGVHGLNERIEVRLTARTVEILHRGRRVAAHARSFVVGGPADAAVAQPRRRGAIMRSAGSMRWRARWAQPPRP